MISFELISPIALEGFCQLIQQFFSVEKTLTLWNYGLINKDSGCDVLVRYLENEIRLAVRIIDHEKQLNVKNSMFDEFAKFVYMRYYIVIKSLLNKKRITYKVSLEI